MRLPYYEIKLGERRIFGNVALNEFHQFQQDGDFYLFNVATMTPYRIPQSVAHQVEKVASSFGGSLISEQTMDELKKLDLVAGNEREPTVSSDGRPAHVANSADLASTTPYGISNLALFVAQQCNMDCVYCYGRGGEYANKGMMTAQTAFKSVDWLMRNANDIATLNIGFFGGEPLMNFPLIKRVVSYAKQEAEKRGKTITFGITTNASLLSDQRITFLREERIKPIISFDGTPEIQNRQRPLKNGKGSYDRTHVNIQKLKKAFPNIVARATLYGDTDPAEIRAGMDLAGLRFFSIKKASHVILDNPSPVAVLHSDQSETRMIDIEKCIARDLLRGIKGRSLVPQVANSIVGLFVRRLISRRKRHYFCGVGRGMAAISITGDIYPCHRFAGQNDVKLGNIDSYESGEINKYHRAAVDNLLECKQCWVRYACGGGCFYEGKAARGDIYLPDRSFCRETRALMKIAIPLYLRLDDGDKAYMEGGTYN